jgi:hypothetical protein
MRQRWTIKREPRSICDMPTWRSERRARRFAEHNTCQHVTYTVVPYVPPCACGANPSDVEVFGQELPIRTDLGWGYTPRRCRHER